MLDGFVPWPEADAERYRREGYWRGEALGDVLRAPARAHPDDVAVATASAHVTFGEVDARADRFAAGLQERGLRPGQRVVVQLPNIPEFLVVTLGLLRAGVLPVFALPAHRAAEIRYLCELSGAVAYVIADRHGGFDYRDLAREVATGTGLDVLVAGDPQGFASLDAVSAEPDLLRPAPAGSDVAFFLLSGGTTGLPKLIPRTHDDYAYQLRACAEGLGVGRASRYLAALPVAHNAALGCPGLLGTYLAGGRTVLAASPAPDEVFPLVEQEGVTLTTLMPPLVKLWIETAPYFGVDVSGVLLQIGSAVLPLEIARRIRPVLGCEITHWFGMAEGLLTFTRPGAPDEVSFTSTGYPLCPADELRVVDEHGEDVPPGEVGELWTRGPYTLRGYYRAEEHNARAFSPDGFFRTGDLVRFTPEGNMVIEGRVKDVINRGGEKVSAAEIEDHLLAHPAVHDVAVIAVPDDALGERTCACVIAARAGEPPTLADLRVFLQDRGVAGYKLPDRLVHLDTFPHTRVGKVNKAELRRMAGEAALPTA
jgi:2,3-dihydroxybenzoate-AMP ligase